MSAPEALIGDNWGMTKRPVFDPTTVTDGPQDTVNAIADLLFNYSEDDHFSFLEEVEAMDDTESVLRVASSYLTVVKPQSGAGDQVG